MRSRKQLMDITKTFSEGISSSDKYESGLGAICQEWNKRMKGFEKAASGKKKKWITSN